MNNLSSLNTRIHDRLTIDWLTPSEYAVWDQIQRFDPPPHRVINVYGAEGTGKTFLGWIMERERYASYSTWGGTMNPTLPRLIVDDAPMDKPTSRGFRPMVEQLGVKQIILLTRSRVDEPALPAFELKVDDQDLEHFGAMLFRHLRLTMPDGNFRNYKSVIEALAR